MEWIAENPYRFVVRAEIPAIYDTKGRLVSERRRGPYAQFTRGSAPPYAQKIGVATFEMATRPMGGELGGGVPPEQWLAHYDSEADQQLRGWTDEERAEIEAHLETCTGILRVERPRVASPWPAYDKLVAQGRRTIDLIVEKIREKVVEDGYDPGAIIAYELENLNRAAVIEAMQALIEQPEQPAEAEELVEA